MNWLGWIVSIVGVVGIGGAIALAIFAPTILAVLVKGANAILESILSTRIGVGLLVGAVCLIAGTLYGEHHGYKRRVAIEVAQQTKILNARIVTLQKAADLDAKLADMDAAAIARLQDQIATTPANPKAALSRDAIKRIGEIK